MNSNEQNTIDQLRATLSATIGLVDTKDEVIRNLSALISTIYENHEFAKSYRHTLGEFIGAVVRCHENGDEFEDVLDRKYEEGFAEGMAHAYMLLTGDVFEHAISTDDLERDIRNDQPPFICPACKQWRLYTSGSGDCQACENCCKCIGQTEGYCYPYGATSQKEG